jgi:hypothetical protein
MSPAICTTGTAIPQMSNELITVVRDCDTALVFANTFGFIEAYSPYLSVPKTYDLPD